MFKSLELADIKILKEIESERIQIAELDDVSRWIDLAISSIPEFKKYQDSLLKIEEYFEESGLEGDDLHLWRAYKNLFAQRFSGIYDDVLQVTDVIAHDLFKYFATHTRLKEARSRYSRGTIPLTFLGKSEDYYITYTHDMEHPIAVISIPQGRVSSVWNWLAIPHEIGHNIFAHYIDFESELWGKINRLLQKGRFRINLLDFSSKISGKKIMQTIWRFWLDELVADVFGVLFTGPAFVMSRHSDSVQAAEEMGGIDLAIWNLDEMEMSRHPTASIRPLLGSKMLRILGFEDIGDELDERWFEICRQYSSTGDLLWVNETPDGVKKLFTIPIDEMLRSFDIIIPEILTGSLKCLGGESLMNIIRFDNLDFVISRVVADELINGIDEFARYVKPRHLLSATRLAFESHPDQADLIHSSAMKGLIYYKNNHSD
ncbi:hypothetical protein KKB99_04020 [bacterium]|nr:hypothetical protein [bacterium]MBU1025160.1 hypothetical protein [bacterium]